MLLSKDKNKKKKDPNNQENDERNQTGESGVKPEVPNQQSIQDIGQGVVEGATDASDMSGVGRCAFSVTIEIESSSSTSQPSSSLENIYMRQGARPKTRTQSKVAQQSTGQFQSIGSQSSLPPVFVKRMADVSLEKAECDTYICGTKRRSDQSTRSREDLPSRFAKCASDIFLTKPQNNDLDIHDTDKEKLIHSLEELDVALPTESGGDHNVLSDVVYKKCVSLQQKCGSFRQFSNSCLARLRGMHMGYLNFFMKRLFMAQGNTLVMRGEYLQMLSNITKHSDEAVVLVKLNLMSQYLLAFGAYQVSRSMLTQKLSNSDFYAIDILLLELILVSYKERVNLYCAQREVLRMYAIMDYNSGYNPNCSNIKFCYVMVQLFRDLLSARQSMVLGDLDLQLVNLLIISVSIQIDLMNRSVYGYLNNRGYSTGCCKSEVLNLCNKVCKGFSYMYNATPNAISREHGIPLPKVLLHMCSSKFCDELSQVIQENRLQFRNLLSDIVENINYSVRNEGLDNVERILGICEEIIRTHGVCDDQQEEQSQPNKEELYSYFSFDDGYGR
ncbi:hypothetical protein EHRUM1_08700 [Ehrlichia ruminantium]|nr:hypothetical protein [Ehrlichia ruminantium]GAT76682.1 hypothetical protein EHRUM1_08700 [Ehrlichia ruminantium]